MEWGETVKAELLAIFPHWRIGLLGLCIGWTLGGWFVWWYFQRFLRHWHPCGGLCPARIERDHGQRDGEWLKYLAIRHAGGTHDEALAKSERDRHLEQG